jgi:uncharacterized lipoprotein YmbA
MMTSGWIRNIAWTFVIGMVVFTGCRSKTPPVKFYTLSSITQTSEETSVTEVDQPIAIGVGPMEIPKTIDRPQIVVRINPNKLEVDEFQRWAGSLYEDILEVLTENLSILLKSNLVSAHPWEDFFNPDYRIVLDVHRFDGSLGDHIVLNVTWTITDGKGREALLVRKSIIREPVLGKDFEAFVEAKSRALATFSQEIAREVTNLGS